MVNGIEYPEKIKYEKLPPPPPTPLCLQQPLIMRLTGRYILTKLVEILYFRFNPGPAILGDPGAVSQDDRMFVVKVYCSSCYSKLSPQTFYRPN